jgi:hypothetical protein
VLALFAAGCKDDAGAGSGTAATIDIAEVEVVRDAMARGMRATTVDKLTARHVGKKCVVMADLPDGGYQPEPPPPPLGFIRLFGSTAIVYNGELDAVESDSITVRSAYPSGSYKRFAIPRSDVQSIHLGE